MKVCRDTYTHCELNIHVYHKNAYKYEYTVNLLYTETRYEDKIHYNDNLTDTKPSLERWQIIRFYVRIMYLIIQETYNLDIC